MKIVRKQLGRAQEVLHTEMDNMINVSLHLELSDGKIYRIQETQTDEGGRGLHIRCHGHHLSILPVQFSSIILTADSV